MHGAAYLWTRDSAPDAPGHVLDVGGRNVNGSVRDCFPAALSYTALDVLAGDGVDIVADATVWDPDRQYDTVVCNEVFEHTPDWPAILRTIRRALAPGGEVILTMAGPGRAPHSAIDGRELRAGEYYGNVQPLALLTEMQETGFDRILVDVKGSDVRAWATTS